MKVHLTKSISHHQLSWRNDERVNAYTRQNGLISQQHHDDWLKKIQSDPTIQMFGIRNEAKSEVGTAGLTSINLIHGTAEFSLLIGPEYHRQGYGKAALVELLKYGFSHLPVNAIFGETFQDNPALRMFLDLGMKQEGRVRQRYFKRGKYIDAFIISILRSEAEQQPWYQ